MWASLNGYTEAILKLVEAKADIKQADEVIPTRGGGDREEGTWMR